MYPYTSSSRAYICFESRRSQGSNKYIIKTTQACSIYVDSIYKDAIVVVTNEPESSFYGQVSQSGATAEKVASRDKFEPFLDFY